jgi:two-component system, sensor histidine kinase YesM
VKLKKLLKSSYLKSIYLDSSLATKIRLSYFIMVIPILIFAAIWVVYLSDYNKRYDKLVYNTSAASAFSLDFKKDFDDKLYFIIIGSQTYEEADPISEIEKAKSIIQKIKDNKGTKYTKNTRPRIALIEKYLNNLEKYSEMIRKNVETGNMYDKNMTIWENDVQVVTSLIQDTILEYLYYETKEIENYRNEMNKAFLQMIRASILLIIVLMGITTIISYAIPRSIIKPIRYLGRVTEQVSKGDLTVRSRIKNGAEVKSLSDSLNLMIQRISDLFEAVKTEQKNLREAELELLQIQINPHFLYNTLDTIVWLAEAGKHKEVVSTVGALSDFFRSSLNQGKDIITVQEETLHFTCYLKIQQVRYQDILDYEINIPESINDCLIPKLTLQPLIENALYHGIKNRRGKGKIIVSGRQEEGKCILMVEDNGIGMNEERLKEVTLGITNKSGTKNDFYGLYNVNERIQLKFGEEYGLRIQSNYGEGTLVEVYLPYSERNRLRK